MNIKDAAKILGLTGNITPKETKAAFRKAAMQSQGAVFVPPSIRLRATQSLDPNEVVPLEGVPVNSNIQVEGVDGE